MRSPLVGSYAVEEVLKEEEVVEEEDVSDWLPVKQEAVSLGVKNNSQLTHSLTDSLRLRQTYVMLGLLCLALQAHVCQ